MTGKDPEARPRDLPPLVDIPDARLPEEEEPGPGTVSTEEREANGEGREHKERNESEDTAGPEPPD